MTTKRINRLYEMIDGEIREPEKDVNIDIKLSDLYRAMAVAQTLTCAVEPACHILHDEFERLLAAVAAILADDTDDFYALAKRILIREKADGKKDAFIEFLRDLADGLEEDEDE